ncbi:MAG: MBL fold metallo-hydrolase [Clostridiales bacterium]|nr:MBL fold metallo-hydrolase [Clostridiales bacterium]
MDISNIEVFTQSSIRIRCEAGNVYIDPFRMKDAPHDADLILITHDHYDHFSPDDLAGVIGPSTVLVVPEKLAAKAAGTGLAFERIETVMPGRKYRIAGLSFETVASYNRLKPFHPKSAGWIGYILHTDGKRVFIAGDTDKTDENSAVACDIALVPVGGKFTMDAKEAAALINTIRPAVAIPTHYGTIVGKKSDGDRFASLVDPAVEVRNIIRD